MFTRRVPVAALVATLSVGVSDLHAQDVQDDLIGKRVRVFHDGQRRTGTLTAVLPDSLLLISGVRDSQSRYVLPVAGITRFEVSLGRHSNTGKGALIGLAVGAVVGVIAGSNDPNNFLGPGGQAAVVGIMGGLGAGIGALFGRIPVESWEEVRLE